jgi:hypothetical protein
VKQVGVVVGGVGLGLGGLGCVSSQHGAGQGRQEHPLSAGSFFPKGSYLYDRQNSLQLVIELVLFINLNICG